MNDYYGMYSFLLNQLDVGIHLVNEQGKTVIYNQKMQNLKGEKTSSVSMQNYMIFNVLKTKETIKNHKQNFWLADGREIVMLSDFLPIFENEQFCGVVEIAKDITSRDLLAYQPLRRYDQPLMFETITAISPMMQAVIHRAKAAAHHHIPTLLYGESGTGKDMIAEGIHHELKPTTQQFITLICLSNEAAILQQIKKQFERDVRSTIFCDRLEHLSLNAQQKLLQLLKANLKGNAFIASVGTDPIALIAKGKLLKELYYFFAEVCIRIPALRERREDIMPFINDYMKRYCDDTGNHLQKLSPKVEQLVMTYDWPGNLKELEVLLDETTSMMTKDEEVIEFDMLPIHFRWKMKQESDVQRETTFTQLSSKKDIKPLSIFMEEMEASYIQNALDLFEGNVSQTAKALGIRRQSLQYRLKKYEK